MQKGAFLIHSRNIHCDFPSTFAVCPPDLSIVEMEQMRNKILSATRFIDSLPPHEVRRLVVSCGDKVLAGVVSFLENMASGDRGDARFFRDKEGRPLYAFIGVVFHTGGQGVPILTPSVLWINSSNIWNLCGNAHCYRHRPAPMRRLTYRQSLSICQCRGCL